MTPVQLNALSSIHSMIHNPDGKPLDYKGSRTVNKLDPDDARTPAVLAGIASMKLPRKK